MILSLHFESRLLHRAGLRGLVAVARELARLARVARAMQCPRSMDFVAILLALGFFAACWGLVVFCERLQG